MKDYQNKIKNFLTMGIEIVTNPTKNLKKYKDHKMDMFDIILYVAIFNFMSFIGLFIGHILYWNAQLLGTIILSLFLYIGGVISVVLAGFILNLLAPACKIKQDQFKIMKLTIFALTPLMLVGFVNIYPIWPLFAITILSIIYGIFIFYKGIEIILEVSIHEKILFLIFATVIMFIGLGIYFGLWVGFENIIYGTLWPYEYGYNDFNDFVIPR